MQKFVKRRCLFVSKFKSNSISRGFHSQIPVISLDLWRSSTIDNRHRIAAEVRTSVEGIGFFYAHFEKQYQLPPWNNQFLGTISNAISIYLEQATTESFFSKSAIYKQSCSTNPSNPRGYYHYQGVATGEEYKGSDRVYLT
jgi:isopenicillin N synthase-like dioxygenase